MSDFDRRIRLARQTASESKKIRNEYQLEADLNEIAGLSDIIGIGKKIRAQVQGMAKDVWAEMKNLFAGIIKLIQEPFKAAAMAAAARLLLGKEHLDRASKLGIPDAVLATPCAFWIVDIQPGGGLKKDDAIALIRQHGKKLPDEVWEKLSLVEESIDRDTINHLFEQWTILTEAIEDYVGKKPNDWVIKLVRSARMQSEFTGAKDDDFAIPPMDSNVVLANLVISSALTDDNDKNLGLLKAAYGDDDEDFEGKKDWKDAIEASVEKRYDSLAVMARVYKVKNNKSLTDMHGSDLILGKEFRKSYTQAGEIWKKWEAYMSENGIDPNDPDSASKGLTGLVEKTPAGKATIDTDPEFREVVMKVFVMKEWYESVWNSIGQKNLVEIRGLLDNQFKGAIGNEFSKLQEVTDPGGMSGEYKQIWEGWVADLDPDMQKVYEFADEKNNSEIMSRMVAIFRPVLVEAFTMGLKELDVVKDLPGKFNELIDAAKSFGYKPEDDPGYQGYITLREEFSESLIKTYEDANEKTIKPAAEKASKEMMEIYQKAIEEEGEGEEAEGEGGEGGEGEETPAGPPPDTASG